MSIRAQLQSGAKINISSPLPSVNLNASKRGLDNDAFPGCHIKHAMVGRHLSECTDTRKQPFSSLHSSRTFPFRCLEQSEGDNSTIPLIDSKLPDNDGSEDANFRPIPGLQNLLRNERQRLKKGREKGSYSSSLTGSRISSAGLTIFANELHWSVDKQLR